MNRTVAFLIGIAIALICFSALAAHLEGNAIMLDEDEVKVCDEFGCVVLSKPTLLRIINSCGKPT